MDYGYPKGNVFYRKLGRSYPAIVRAEGIYFYDDKGKRYIDGSGGALVMNIGHGQGAILEKLTDQMRQVSYVHGTQFTTKSIEEYAEALVDILPKGLNKIFFLSGGSEGIASTHV